jgi:phage baseplate assembly protein gpV
MAENVQRSRGRPQGYKFDRGGTPTEMGPYIGIVVNNVDNTRSGRLQVVIEQFAADNKDGTLNLKDQNLWRTVSYCPPFYGATPKGNNAGVGSYLAGNQQSYGMWFTPPDIGTQVLCFFVGGDPNLGYYVGCVPEPGINHMIPAIGSVPRNQAVTQNTNQQTYFAGSPLLPVTEFNNSISNPSINENPKFFDAPKPVHSYVAATLFQQGLASDPVRGSIGSSSQRESPSACYGMSTPGRPIYQGGLGGGANGDRDALQELNSESLADLKVIARRGGHTFVMDDGNLVGDDNLIRIRTSKGHQITMSDDGNCFYITHANGQAWIELGQEGTVDVYATNSVNVRTEGTINLHADKDINMFAGGKINMKSVDGTAIQSDGDLNVACKKNLTLFASTQIGVKSNGTLALKGKLASMEASGPLSLKGLPISLNGAPGQPIATPKGITKTKMPDVSFNNSVGWTVSATGLESIVTRAPTHEPYPYHNQGVSNTVNLADGQTTASPGAPEVPDEWSITKK